MKYIDIHTHQKNTDWEIRSCEPADFQPEYKGWYSVGLHPQNLTQDWAVQYGKLQVVAKQSQVLAIGECGLDKNYATIWERQKEVFEAQVYLAERIKKPMILHVVKAYDELIQIHRKWVPMQAWVIHGFRKSEELAEQLLEEGFYLSVNDNTPDETVRAIPLERLFLETDESEIPISALYEKVAAIRGISVADLAKVIRKNSRLFW